MSKKEPPLREDLVAEDWRVWPVGDVRLAKGEGFVAGCCGEVKERELNASFMPPNCELGCCCAGDVRGGEDMPDMPANALIFD